MASCRAVPCCPYPFRASCPRARSSQSVPHCGIPCHPVPMTLRANDSPCRAKSVPCRAVPWHVPCRAVQVRAVPWHPRANPCQPCTCHVFSVPCRSRFLLIWTREVLKEPALVPKGSVSIMIFFEFSMGGPQKGPHIFGTQNCDFLC